MSVIDLEILKGLVNTELEAVNDGWQLGSKEYAARLQSILNELENMKGDF